MTPRRLLLLLRTARTIPPAQLAARLRLAASRAWRRLAKRRFRPPKEAVLASHFPLWSGLESAARHASAAEHLTHARDIAAGRFAFVGLEVAYPLEPDWHDKGVPQLWRYHLHYFDYTLDLALLAAAGERDRAFTTFRSMVQSWLRANEVMAGDGWHPYTVSLRVVNWCQALDAFAIELGRDRAFADSLRAATAGQISFLAGNLERDVRGNHIIENLRALLVGGITFAGAEARRWLECAIRLLESEVAEQVTADGGHYERVPSYHVRVLTDLLEIEIALRRNGREVPEWLDTAVTRMADFLDGLVMADGRLPLLKDTTYDGPDPSNILALAGVVHGESRWKRTADAGLHATIFDADGASRYAALSLNTEPRRTRFFEVSRFAVFRSARDFTSAVVDVGPPCPEALPAHAHADLLSFELCLDGRRTIVDSGVFEYTAGRWRDYFRSTSAHNTVEVEGSDQSEVWSSFRVARRARPLFATFTELPGLVMVEAEHDGYERLPARVRHRRKFVWLGGAGVAVIDELSGRGTVTAASRIHLHPACRRDSLAIEPFGGADAVWSESQYSEHFGEMQRNDVLVLTRRAELPFIFGYVIAREAPAVSWDGATLRITRPVEATIGAGRGSVDHATPAD
jgi:uncharacterized heparinase superfamily protein